MDYVQVDAKKVPWVFWIRISWQKTGWFKNFWKTRGANFIDVIIFKRLKISVGCPWRQININYYLSDYGNLKHIEKTNNDNSKNPWSLLINPNP